MTNNANDPRRAWDESAHSFDDAPDHGLRDPAVRQAWVTLLRGSLPLKGGSALDVGCGTGSLSVILAEMGYAVTGIDFSPEMVRLAREKAARLGDPVDFQVMDGANPQFPADRFDVILSRHVLWALPEPPQVVRRWANLLKPGGLLLLIEGKWHTGAGLTAQETAAAVEPSLQTLWTRSLSPEDALWGGKVEDERYAILARKNPASGRGDPAGIIETR